MHPFLTQILRPFSPPIETARHYSLKKFRRDIIAGLTVAVVEVPQAMAYAIIAGVPPVYGIYTSIIQGIVGSLLSSSEHMTTGPTNTQSLLIASAVHRVVAPDAPPESYLQLVFGLTLLKGLLQLAFAAARMGDMVRYVSRSVIVGLVSGAGLLIFFGQLPAFLGITSREGNAAPGIIGQIQRVIHHLDQTNWRSIGLGVGVILIVIGARRISKFFPGALVAVISTALAVWFAGWTHADLPLLQPLPPSFPHFNIPQISWAQAEALFGGALALAIIGMLESVAIAKSIAAKTGERISANQEFFAQGLKNSVTSFFQCIPGSGSFTRSALDYEAGAATRFAACFNAIFVAVIFLLLGSQAGYIPSSALAAILFVIAFGLIDYAYFTTMLRVSRTDAIVFAATFFSTLVMPLEYAIFIGVLLNIGLYLRRASRLKMNQMVETTPAGPFLEKPLNDRVGNKQVIFLQIEGDLFFGLADELQDQLTALINSGVKIVIFRLKHTHNVDATALHVLETFTKELQSRGGHVLLCGIRSDLMKQISEYGLVNKIGRDNVFLAGEGIFTSAKLAIQRANKLSGASIDASPVDVDEPEEYVI